MATLPALLALALVLTKPAHVVKAQSGCTNATLDGTYGYVLRGFLLPHQGAPLSSALVGATTGIETFDGNGNTSGSETFNGAGSISHPTYTGTYSVNPDCTGSAIVNLSNGSTATAAFTIVDVGKEIEFLNTGHLVVEFGSMKKQ